MGRMLKLNLTTRLIILGAVFILPIVLITVLIIGISSCASKGSNATADLSFSSLNTPRPDSALVETASNQGSEQDDYSVEGNTAPNHQPPQEQATPEPTSTP